MSRSERSLVAQVAAHTSWAMTPDRTARTAPARAALMAKFEAQVDPSGVLSLGERQKRAESLRKAYFLNLARKSAQARRKAAAYSAEADRADAELGGTGGAAA